jgi:hypothetical protein
MWAAAHQYLQDLAGVPAPGRTAWQDRSDHGDQDSHSEEDGGRGGGGQKYAHPYLLWSNCW